MEKPINAFPGYECVWSNKENKYLNMYRGVNLGRGGWVYTEPGIYTNIALLDVASLHPTSIVMLNKLGKYTQRYADLRKARVCIKHGNYEEAGKLFDGKLKPYLTDKDSADSLSSALKLPLNAFFGISCATFDNPAKDSRDKNNIIALRGALFMKTLFDEVVSRGYRIIHVKTDSVKVVNADPSIVQFIQNFAKKYGYEIEHEAVYDRICLVDKSQYIAAYMKAEECEKRYGYIPSANAKHFKKHMHPWTATGDMFQHPYAFKTLFSGEPVIFDDYCELKTVKDAAIYLDMNEKLKDVSVFEKELSKRQHNEEYSEKPVKLNKDLSQYSDNDLQEQIAKGHNYAFIGRTGRFVPIKSGAGGGTMLVNRNGKYDSVNGSKGYRWLEAEVVRELNKQDIIDISYYDAMIDEKIKEVNKFGSFERFIDTSKPYIPPNQEPQDDDGEPPWNELPPVVPCGDTKYNTCIECRSYKDGICKNGYSLNAYIENGGDSD